MAPKGFASSRWYVLRTRNFWPFFVGNLASNCGTWFQTIAQTILVYRLTGSTFIVGIVNFSQFAAVLLLSPWTGTVADHFDRKRLIAISQMAAFLITGLLAVMTWVGVVSAPTVVGTVLILGITTAFATPALRAVLPLLVNREELPTAIALNSLSFNLARGLGPIFGVVVVQGVGIAGAFAINSLSYLSMVVAIGAVRTRQQTRIQSPPGGLRGSASLLRTMPGLGALLVIVIAISLTADPVLTLAPGFATRIFHQSDTFSGYLVGAFGLGSAFAALVILGRFEITWRSIALTSALMGTSIALYALSSSPWVALLVLFLGGACFMTTNTAIQTLLQLHATEGMQGQMMALWSAGFFGFRPIGSLVDGGIAAIAGERLAAACLAIPAMVGAAIAWRSRMRPFGPATPTHSDAADHAPNARDEFADATAVRSTGDDK